MGSFLLTLLLAASDEPQLPTFPPDSTIVMIGHTPLGWTLTMTLATGELERLGPYLSLEACEQDIPKKEKEDNATNGYCEKDPPRHRKQ